MVDVELIAHLAQKYETSMAYAFRRCLGIVPNAIPVSPGTIVPVEELDEKEIYSCFNQRYGTTAGLT